MLQIQSLSLGNLCVPVATSHILNVLQTSTLPPLSWDNSVVVILLITQSLVDTWIPQSHDVVQRATGQYNRGNSLWILTHGGEETTKSVGHDDVLYILLNVSHVKKGGGTRVKSWL